MNTAELKKLAEAASLTVAQLVDMGAAEFVEAHRLKQQFRNIRPGAILELLAINAELVRVLKNARAYGVMGAGWIEAEIDAALAKAEGGEL